MSVALRFRRRFSMAHRLASGSSLKCATPHGHDEYVVVELEPQDHGRLDGEANMVVEFARAKGRWHRFVDERLDHGFQLGERDPLLALAREHFPDWRLVVTPGDPTTELMAACLAAKCQAILDDEGVVLRVRRLTLEETPTNAVVVEGDFRALLPRADGWWSRPDESTE
ncbi:MAG: 6-pyruvoyl tetrahydropterin synthase [Sandaracinus sp.]|nr:6-pyruvoyl tetrahydropterin synthase [Sandaracinus sp.]MAQ15071.1 6-pyruvoyl tetrahydropterin synthase [Sandaracinus sp.]